MGPLKPSSPAQLWPAARRFATLTPLIDLELVGERLCGCGPVLRQRLLLLWGKDSQHHICNETWILDYESFTWTLVSTILRRLCGIIIQTSCLSLLYQGREGVYGKLSCMSASKMECICFV